MLERGVLGGAMYRHDDEGMHIGRLAARVLRTPPGAPLPPVEQVESPFIADWRTLRRFNLDERRLPPGTEVRFRVPSTWERDRSVILTALGIMAAQAILIGALLVERRARRRAQQALSDQSAYERTMADLATDAVRHAPDDAPRALEDALARVGSYAGADAAVLVQYADAASRPESRVYWTRRPGEDQMTVCRRCRSAPMLSDSSSRWSSPETNVGALELYRMRPGKAWPKELATRLVAAAEVIAGAIARSRAAAATSEARRQVAHLGRVAIVGELGSTISHELRQPLTAIRVNAELGVRLLGDSLPDIDEAREVMRDVVADAARASATIEQIRLMLRMQSPGHDRCRPQRCQRARQVAAAARCRSARLAARPRAGTRTAPRSRKRGRAAAGDPQPDAQQLRRGGRRQRAAHRGHRHGGGERVGGAVRARHWSRTFGGGTGPPLRPVLHHQGTRSRHGARDRSHPRGAARRQRRRGEQRRWRCDLPTHPTSSGPVAERRATRQRRPCSLAHNVLARIRTKRSYSSCFPNSIRTTCSTRSRPALVRVVAT